MASTNKVLLKVSDTTGKPIYAWVKSFKGNINIRVGFLQEVKDDNPQFATNGMIRFNCKQTKYKEAIDKLTKYLEDLFLKGIADEDNNTSIKIGNKSGRDKKQNIKRADGKDKRSRDNTSVHSGTRRIESTESIERKINDSEMDKSNNT